MCFLMGGFVAGFAEGDPEDMYFAGVPGGQVLLRGTRKICIFAGVSGGQVLLGGPGR